MANDRKIAILIVVIIALASGLFLRIKNRDIDFSRRVFYYLTTGRNAAQAMIDWQNLKAVGVDVGATYSDLPNDNERTNYRKAFINRFALGFQNTGGNFKSFINWRAYPKPYGQDCANCAVVAADYQGKDKTILFTLSKDGRKKLKAIQWKE
jgi:hypothetical protein